MPTQADIAKKLGISQGAVASVVGSYSGRRLLNPEMEAKVRRVADEMGYRPHRQAQLLRGGKSGVVGILHMGERGCAFSAERMMAVEDAVREAGYEALARDVTRKQNPRDVCDRLLDERVEGILLALPVEWFPVTEISRLRRFKAPLAALSGMVVPGVPQVHADVHEGTMALTDHLLRLGHRRLVFLTAETFTSFNARRDRSWRERIGGFEDAVLQAGGRLQKQVAGPLPEMADNNGDGAAVTGRVVCGPLGPDGGSPYAQAEQAMRGLLAWRRRPDAVLCMNDDWALGALAVCGEEGLRVPDDLAVTGFDGTVQGAYYNPRLTTVAQPIREMADKAMALLLRQMRGERVTRNEMKLVLPCDLVVRASCGARRKRGQTGKEEASDEKEHWRLSQVGDGDDSCDGIADACAGGGLVRGD